MKRSIGLCGMLLLTGTVLAQASGHQARAAGQGRSQDRKSDDTKTVTVSGCLSVNPASRMYVLTTRPDALARSGATDAPTTITYQLVGGQGLEQHVGDRVEVTGRVDPDKARTAESESERSGPPRNAGQSRENARVETKTETKIRTQVLRVEKFRFVEANCKPTGN